MSDNRIKYLLGIDGGGTKTEFLLTDINENEKSRVILGTAAITDEAFLDEALAKYGEKIAVGVDIRDGYVAIKGWTEKSQYTFEDFCKKMQDKGVKTIICTDISKDGAMKGTNRELYKQLNSALSLDIIASGGVSSMDDIVALREMELYGAILGKALYEGKLDLSRATKIAKGEL